jgi:subtilisin family serine protease
MRAFGSSLFCVAFCVASLVSVQGSAAGAESADNAQGNADEISQRGDSQRFLKFRSEAALQKYLIRHPDSRRVHSELMWVEVNSSEEMNLSVVALAALGVEKAESEHFDYRIPKPVRGLQIAGELPSSKLWGISKIQSPTAWNVTRGSADVIVAVVDTGIDFNHPALKGNMWINAAEQNGRAGVDDDGNGYVDDVHGGDFISGKPTPMDDEGHGSHVAGTIAGHLPDEDFYGVAPQVRLMAIKTHNTKGEGSKSSVVKGILYAADNGARVLNCSWGGAPEAAEYDQLLFDAIAYANKKGAVLIASAGNNAANNDTGMHFPSNYDLDGIISVASSTNKDTRSYFSNFGSRTVDLAAPGSNIWSVTAGGSSYEYLSGTSMASPHVSGAAALLLSSPAGRQMTPAQVRETLMAKVVQSPEWLSRVISGGRLDVGFIGGN